MMKIRIPLTTMVMVDVHAMVNVRDNSVVMEKGSLGFGLRSE